MNTNEVLNKLKAEIERRYAEYRAKMKTDNFTYYGGMADALDLFEQYIDSLQQEQPEVELNKETEEYFKGWTETDEGIACHYQYVNLNTCHGIARHFYELGKNSK